ncbi:uncharacterized protein LOC119066515 [Bradysia coprophila]|uniref:uncharacterized protein LOC119066515 n=1 Tax=Bradysia coprophila TaxID=38358 RepID=UPI00187DB1F2|nr:uncharacterized protein LOC119066515 [Bradysia coprophila]
MSRSRMSDVSYSKNPRDMTHQAAVRRYLTNALNRAVAPLQQRVSIAKLQYSQRPLLRANYPVFNDLCREFQSQINSTWNQINNLIRSSRPSSIVQRFDASILMFENRLSVIVDQLFEILSIPDSVILDKLKREIRQKFEDDFELIQQRCDRIPADSGHVAGEKQYYEYLMKEYMNEISIRLDDAYDHSTITTLRVLINRHKRHLKEMVDKIEKLAAGEDLEDSFVLSDLSDDSA